MHPFPFMDRHTRPYLHDEVELGRRPATYLANEAEGWGAWVNARVLQVQASHAIDTHDEWLPNVHREAFIPGQRRPAG